ncbi:MAG TPA: hypothetical protein VF794_23165 [Archangium sp.]|jgi:hypothetical protein|uniref:hypothetical protein n=1 Tax=Archangium sp. TaxID=1872627 RepID=UPI002EDB9A0E
MTRFTRLTMLSAMAAGVVACGGGAQLGGGEEGAAQAAFQASKPMGRTGRTSQKLLDKALASGAVNVTLTAKCTQGGKATLKADLTQVGQNGAIHYSVTYDDCSEDGRNEYNGTMAASMRFDADLSLGTLSFITTMKGKLTIEGEVSDFIDADVTLTMDFNATSARAGNVQLVLDGTVKTSTGSYTYANESLSITAGELPGA